MNANGVRWRLHNYYKDAEKIEQLKNDLKEYRQMDGVKAQVITDMPVSHSNVSVSDKAAERLDYIRDMENELDGLMRVKRAIDDIYRYLKEPARSIIEMRYFITPTLDDVRQRKYNWSEIAIEVNYSEDYCKEIDGKVILKIQTEIHKITHV